MCIADGEGNGTTQPNSVAPDHNFRLLRGLIVTLRIWLGPTYPPGDQVVILRIAPSHVTGVSPWGSLGMDVCHLGAMDVCHLGATSGNVYTLFLWGMDVCRLGATSEMVHKLFHWCQENVCHLGATSLTMYQHPITLMSNLMWSQVLECCAHPVLRAQSDRQFVWVASMLLLPLRMLLQLQPKSLLVEACQP